MIQTDTQVRLRRAFRYGYFAFLVLFLALLVLLGMAVAEGDLGVFLGQLSSATSVMLAALVFGLSVPIFFACWSLIGSALLGERVSSSSMLEGIRD
jgi:hypothetical protein